VFYAILPLVSQNLLILIATTAAAAFAAFLLVPLANRMSLRLQTRLQEHAVEPRLDNGWQPQILQLSATTKTRVIVGAAACAALVVIVKGATPVGLALLVYFMALLLLVAINLEQGILPDLIVFPILWLGLLANSCCGDPGSAIKGAAVGYVAPYCINMLFRQSTGRDGMGHGDFKCLAMSGAWFGIEMIPSIFAAFVVALTAQGMVRGVLGRTGVFASGLGHLTGSIAALVCPLLS
jgi:leader peptidase (prepilin peptidase)/N-methyltransferase